MNRINLTADQARELHSTRRVEIWTEIEPHEGLLFIDNWPYRTDEGGNKIAYALPRGPDGERWVAEPWITSSDGILCLSEWLPGNPKFDKQFRKADTMAYSPDRPVANQTTTVEHVDGKWGFKTAVEGK